MLAERNRGEMEAHINFYSLLIVSSIAFAIPLAISRFKKLGIPVVIAEIIAGVVLGKSGLNIIHNDIWIDFLSLLGFAFLLFLGGMEIDFSYFSKFKSSKKSLKNPIIMSFVIYTITIGLSLFFAFLLHFFGVVENPIFVMLIFSTSALGIVIPTLREKKLMSEPIGQSILLAAIIADFGTMLALPLVMFLYGYIEGITLIYLLGLFALFAVIYLVMKKFFRSNWDNQTYENSQIKVRVAFVLLLLFVTVAELVNIEIILGAFLAGVLFSLVFGKFKVDTIPKLEAIGYGFLIPIFFIMVGANLDLGSALSLKTLITLPLFMMIAYLVKLIPSLLFKKYYSWRETLGVGFLLSSRFSLVIAISLVALRIGAIDEGTHSMFVLLAILTCVFSPIIFLKVFPPISSKKQHIVFVGSSDQIVGIANKLVSEETEFILVQSNEKIREKFDDMQIAYTYLEELTKEAFDQIKELNIISFVASSENDAKNEKAASLAQNMGVDNIVALVNDPLIAHELEKKEIRTITPMKAMNTLLYGNIKYPESFHVMYDFENDKNIIMKEFKLNNHRSVGLTLRQIKMPGDCLILMVSRKGRRIVPDGNTKLEKGDVIIIMGSHAFMDEIDSII